MEKIYLKTAEEITKALKEGRTVYTDIYIDEKDKWITKQRESKLVNGLLVNNYEGVEYISETIYVNPDIFRYYYEI